MTESVNAHLVEGANKSGLSENTFAVFCLFELLDSASLLNFRYLPGFNFLTYQNKPVDAIDSVNLEVFTRIFSLSLCLAAACMGRSNWN